MQLSSAIVDFYLFSDGPVDIHVWALLIRSQSRIFDTQATVQAHGPPVKVPFFLFFTSVISTITWNGI